MKRDLVERKAKRDADKARKAEEEKRRKEQDDLLSQQRQVRFPTKNFAYATHFCGTNSSPLDLSTVNI